VGKLKRAIVIVIIILIFSALLVAQQKKKGKGLVLEDIDIEGKIQKPEAIYFLSRARFNYKSLNLDISFIKKVKEAVHKDSAF